MLGLWLSVSVALLIALFGRGGVGESIAFACLAQDWYRVAELEVGGSGLWAATAQVYVGIMDCSSIAHS
jgi:hypothetical protein